MSNPENLNQAEQSALDLKIRKYAFALAVSNVFIIYGFFLIGIWCFFSPQCVQFDLVSKHYVIIIGMPVSAMAAGAFVTLLRSVDGPIKFKCIGFEFEGAAGQIVMFVLVFLSFVLASPRYETSDRHFNFQLKGFQCRQKGIVEVIGVMSVSSDFGS